MRSWLPFGTGLQASAQSSWGGGNVVAGANPASNENVLKRQKDWQKRVLSFADSIPEVSSTGSYVHNTLNLVNWKVEGSARPETLEILTRGLEGFNAGRVAENVFYVGEMLTGYAYDAAEGKVVWDSWSHAEWKKESGMVKLLGSDGSYHSPDAGMNVFPIRRPDRERKHEAYSPHKSMIQMLEAWYLYQLVDTRLAQSRLAGAGILHIPGDDLPSIPPTGDGDNVPGSREEFLDELVDSMLQPITDANSEDAVVPFLFFGKAENADALKHIMTERIDDPVGFQTRMDSYAQRYARGVDLPAEILLGTADANHWTAWKIDDDTATYYINPAAKRIALPLTRNYVEPLLEVLGDTGSAHVVPDLTEIIARPDKSEPAARAFENGAITKEAYVREIGMTDDDIDEVGVPLRQRSSVEVRGGQTFAQAPPQPGR